MDGDATERNRLDSEARGISAEIGADMGIVLARQSRRGHGGPRGKDSSRSKSKSLSRSRSSSKKLKKSKKKRRSSSSSSSSSLGEEPVRSRRRRLLTSEKLKRERWPEGYDTDVINDFTFREALAKKEVEEKMVMKDRDSLPGVRVARKEAKLKNGSIPAGIRD